MCRERRQLSGRRFLREDQNGFCHGRNPRATFGRADERVGKLAEEGDVGGSGAAILVEGVAEVVGEEMVFDADADLGADDEDNDGEDEEKRRRDEKAGAEEHSEHGCVDGMADETVGAPSDELMVGGKRGIETPLAAEGARRGPGKKYGEQQEED